MLRCILIFLSGHFPEPSRCPQFLRHKSYLASPMMLAKTSCRPNTLVQHAGEFVVNFALDSWIELGRKAQACNCVNYRYRLRCTLDDMNLIFSAVSASMLTSFFVIENFRHSPLQRPA